MYSFVNCDIGERGANHPVDDELLRNVQCLNIACGGHAGNDASVDWYMAMARKYDKMVTAHLSYPDKENFGRVSMEIGIGDLSDSLDAQWKMMTDRARIKTVNAVKFHGALYNDSVANIAVASVLACWLFSKGIKTVVTADTGFLAKECRKRDIEVIPEFFAERNYVLEKDSVKLCPRTKAFASIHDLGAAVAHTASFVSEGIIEAYQENESFWEPVKYKFPDMEKCTICIHSDSEIALDLAKALQEVI